MSAIEDSLSSKEMIFAQQARITHLMHTIKGKHNYVLIKGAVIGGSKDIWGAKERLWKLSLAPFEEDMKMKHRVQWEESR